jgi:protein TonB
MFITICLLLGLLALSIALHGTEAWSNVLSPVRNDLVFADRNRSYGAYVLRREHHRVLLISFMATMGLMSLLVLLPGWLSTPPEPLPRPDAPMIDVDLTQVLTPPSTVAPPASPPPPSTPARPLERGVPMAVDSVPTVVDTVSTSPTPVAPGPVGPDPGPTVPGTRGMGTVLPTDTVVDGWAADESPEYPGGQDALYRDLKRLVRYPDIAVARNEQGRVTVGFVVNEDGRISDVTVLRGVSPSIDAEAVRVVRAMKPWRPGRFRGRSARVRFNLPIVFTLSDR